MPIFWAQLIFPRALYFWALKLTFPVPLLMRSKGPSPDTFLDFSFVPSYTTPPYVKLFKNFCCVHYPVQRHRAFFIALLRFNLILLSTVRDCYFRCIQIHSQQVEIASKYKLTRFKTLIYLPITSRVHKNECGLLIVM